MLQVFDGVALRAVVVFVVSWLCVRFLRFDFFWLDVELCIFVVGTGVAGCLAMMFRCVADVELYNVVVGTVVDGCLVTITTGLHAIIFC